MDSYIHNARYRWINDPDKDGDNLPDLWEEQLLDSTFPTIYDIDGSVDHDLDGVSTYLEWKHHTIPGDPESYDPDLDRDHLTNLEETQAGSNPNDPGSWMIVPLSEGYVHANDRNQVVSYSEESGIFKLKRYTAGNWADLGIPWFAGPTRFENWPEWNHRRSAHSLKRRWPGLSIYRRTHRKLWVSGTGTSNFTMSGPMARLSIA